MAIKKEAETKHWLDYVSVILTAVLTALALLFGTLYQRREQRRLESELAGEMAKALVGRSAGAEIEARARLAKYGKEAVPLLILALDDPQTHARVAAAARDIVELDPDSIPAVVQKFEACLLDPRALRKKGCAIALGEVRSPIALPALQRTLEPTQDQEVLKQVCIALEKIPDRSSIDLLLKVIANPQFTLSVQAQAKDTLTYPSIVALVTRTEIAAAEQLATRPDIPRESIASLNVILGTWEKSQPASQAPKPT